MQMCVKFEARRQRLVLLLNFADDETYSVV